MFQPDSKMNLKQTSICSQMGLAWSQLVEYAGMRIHFENIVMGVAAGCDKPSTLFAMILFPILSLSMCVHVFLQ